MLTKQLPWLLHCLWQYPWLPAETAPRKAAPYGEYAEYESLLREILSSIRHTDSFSQIVANGNAEETKASSIISQAYAEISEIYARGWENRQKSYDIISEKTSDAAPGYERVCDVETNEVYKAYNGFLDIPGNDNYYRPVTDEMYSLPVNGYIEK